MREKSIKRGERDLIQDIGGIERSGEGDYQRLSLGAAKQIRADSKVDSGERVGGGADDEALKGRRATRMAEQGQMARP